MAASQADCIFKVDSRYDNSLKLVAALIRLESTLSQACMICEWPVSDMDSSIQGSEETENLVKAHADATAEEN